MGRAPQGPLAAAAANAASMPTHTAINQGANNSSNNNSNNSSNNSSADELFRKMKHFPATK